MSGWSASSVGMVSFAIILFVHEKGCPKRDLSF